MMIRWLAKTKIVSQKIDRIFPNFSGFCLAITQCRYAIAVTNHLLAHIF
ncbi:MAG: hypothetical protein ACKO4S_06995 [Snowella sp.]